MSDQATIATIKSQMLALIAAITENPKPSYSIDGQSVSWSDYLRQLQGSVERARSNAGPMGVSFVRTRTTFCKDRR